LSFTFSAKEKDVETGLSYFGSRYYSSDLSIWLSVDPMSGKYPHQSNYVYCSNNPLKVIDPNGEDEWEVNKSGHIRHVEGSAGKPDKLFVVRGFGAKRFKNRTEVEGLDVDAELMKNLFNSEKGGKIVFSQTCSDDKSKKIEEMFNFLADNTNVEWTLATVDYPTGYGTTLERKDFLMTDHDRTRSKTATELTLNCCSNGGLIRLKHSHPAFYSLIDLLEHNSISTPSGNPQGSDDKGDYGHRRLCTKPGNSPNAIFILRYRGHDRIY
jgi:RHS repeat-associated protein